MGERKRRNQELASIREALKGSPSNLELANRYWSALAGGNGDADLQSGSDVIVDYREAAISSTLGVTAFAAAYRKLFEISGEIPRSILFDDALATSLKATRPELSGTDRRNVEWILHSIGGSQEAGR